MIRRFVTNVADDPTGIRHLDIVEPTSTRWRSPAPRPRWNSLPADDRNGIARIAAALCDNPESAHLIVALVDCTKVTTMVDSGDIVPTARIRAIEGFESGTPDGEDLRRLMRRAYERRTGRVELPLEMEKAFDAIADEPSGD